MERAPLRPVAGRPSGPVPDAAAVALVSSAIPGLSVQNRTALALVGVAGRPRGEVASRLGIGEPELSQRLAQARKALRRTLAALEGSGWCEHAERLISDRIDGALADRDAPRLDAHLRNCPRCVEHERRLVQATDALLGGATSAPAPPVVEAVPAPRPAPLPRPSAEPPDVPLRRDLVGALGWLLIAVVLALVALALALALGAQL